MAFLIVLITAACAVLAQASLTSGTGQAPKYKMTTYQLVILTRGPSADIANSAKGRQIIDEHVKYVYKLGADGKSMVAGPLLDGGEIRGLIVIKAESPDEAQEIGSADPAVRAGIFAMEVAPFLSPEGWFGTWAEMGRLETVYFGFLQSGPNRGQDAETARRLQAEHLAYMSGQSNEGKLVLAGPFTAGGTRRGVVVYRVADAAEAKRRAEGDPMVKVGRLAVELHPWQVPVGALPSRPR